MALMKTIEIPARTNLKAIYPQFEVCMKSDKETLQNAYIKIEGFSGNKTIDYKIGVYTERGSTELIFTESYTLELNIEDNAPSIQKQIYSDLKNHEKYQEAHDVLEDGQTV